MDTIATCIKLAERAMDNGELSVVIMHYAPSPHFSEPCPYIHNLDLMRRYNRLVDVTKGLSYVWHTIEGMLDFMPPKARNVQHSQGNMPEMIQSKLRDDELNDFEEWWKEAQEELLSLVEDHLLSDHKLGVSWDAYNDCFIASSTAKGEHHVNAGKCLLSRSTLWTEAIGLNLYKTILVFKNGVWQPRKENQQRG